MPGRANKNLPKIIKDLGGIYEIEITPEGWIRGRTGTEYANGQEPARHPITRKLLEKVPRPQVLLKSDDAVEAIFEAHIPRVEYFEEALLWHFPTYIGHLNSTAEVLRVVVEWNRYKNNIKNHQKANKRKSAMLENNWMIPNSQKEKIKEQITCNNRLTEQNEANTHRGITTQRPAGSAWKGEEPARLPQQAAMNLESKQLIEDLKNLDNAINYCPSIVRRTKAAKGQVQLIRVWSQIITQKRSQDQNWQQIRIEALENETRVLTKHNISLLRWINLQPGTQNQGEGSPNCAKQICKTVNRSKSIL